MTRQDGKRQWVRNSERLDRRKINLVTLKKSGEREKIEEEIALEAKLRVAVTVCLGWRVCSWEEQRSYPDKHWCLLSLDWRVHSYIVKQEESPTSETCQQTLHDCQMFRLLYKPIGNRETIFTLLQLDTFFMNYSDIHTYSIRQCCNI